MSKRKESDKESDILSEAGIKAAAERISSLRARPGRQAVPEIIQKQLDDLRAQLKGDDRNRAKQD